MNLKELKQKLAALVEQEALYLQSVADGREIIEDERRMDGVRSEEMVKLRAEITDRESIQERLRGHLETRPKTEPLKPAEERRFGFLGEQLSSVATAFRLGLREIDPRLMQLAPSGASEGVPSDGGFLVQKDFSQRVLARTYEVGQILQRCANVEISGPSNGTKIPYIDESSRVNGSRWGGIEVSFINEGGTATATKIKFGRIEIELEKMMGKAIVTEELLVDARQLESIYMATFPLEMAFVAEDRIINGNGAGNPLGILKSDSLVSVAKEAAQAAATVKPENIVKMRARLWARSRPNSVWLINQDIEPQLHLMQLGAAGPVVYMPAGGLSGSPFDLLYGRPVIPVEYCATLGTQGDIILADLSQYITITKGGMRADSSMHVKFETDEMMFRFIWRFNGQPAWKKPLTPLKGTATQSPFVTLDTRA